MNEKTKKKSTPTFFNTNFQRPPKFLDPEIYGKIHEKLESFKYIFRIKFRTNYDWYPIKNMKFNYAFSFLKHVVRIQMLLKMNEKNVLKFHSIEKLLHCLNINFGN